MNPEKNEEIAGLEEMKRLASAAVFEFLSVKNGLGRDGCFCRAADLPEILNLSTDGDPVPGGSKT